MKDTNFEQGTFFVGCNYWASHAGMRMWSMWDEAVVEDDLRRLSEARITTLRIFPLWSDFQPLRMHYGGNGAEREIRMGEEPLPDTEAGRAGVDEAMTARFAKFCDIARSYGLRLIVGLVTGWMSGRLFVPEMLQGRNILTDPMAIKWQIKYVRHMVRTFHSHPAIIAWDLGNECNCMGKVVSPDEGYVWAATISMAIRCEDDSHPIVSGMHGLKPNGNWRMQDQGEFLDVLCTHPYPLFTPHCDTDPLINMKSPLHATAESLFYSGIGGKQCFAEETGVLGPMMISDEHAADYIRAVMLTLMAHDCRGMLWWCGFEQSELRLTPYDWNGVERELGLFYIDKTRKPVLDTIAGFSEFVERLPVEKLPGRIVDAVCILNPGQDTWAAAYGTFILAKQAGVDIEFAWVDGHIPEARAYILPDQEGDSSLPRRVQRLLVERVEKGAKLYMSMDGPLMSPFTSMTGLRVLYRDHRPRTDTVTINGTEVPLECERSMTCETTDAEVIARTADGRIAFARCRRGAGEVYTLLYPIEKLAATVPGVVDGEGARNMQLFYRALGLRSPEKCACVDSPTVGITEHIIDDSRRVLILVNYEPDDACVTLELKDGFRIKALEYVDGVSRDPGEKIFIPHNSGLAVMLER